MINRLPRLARVVAALALLAAFTTGCSLFGGGAVAPRTDVPTGMSVDIKKIGATSTLEPMGLNEDRTIQTPPLDKVEQAGWYSLGPAPGDVGPAVVMGHINGNGKKGIFARLAEPKAGDKVTITRDGKPLSFTITRVDTVPKDRFPTAQVYSDTQRPEIRLITCGGDLDRAARSYLSNVVAYGTLDA